MKIEDFDHLVLTVADVTRSWRFRPVGLGVLLLAVFFASSAFGVSQELVEIRQQTKSLLSQRHCFNCHSPEGKRPLDRAMKVYNLGRENWFNSMSDRQLTEFQRRILDKMSPEELKEMGGSPKEPPLANQQKRLVRRFVELELENRRVNPLERTLGN